MRRQLGVYFLALSFMLVSAAKVPAGGPTFTTIDAPGAIYTEAVDINDFGLIVGRYYDGLPPCTIPCTAADGHNHGYLRNQQGSFTEVDFPNSDFTGAAGINPVGDIVGIYHLQGASAGMNHGFLLSGGQFTSIDFPPPAGSATVTTAAWGINLAGDIVGQYRIKNLVTGAVSPLHGFLRGSGGQFTSIDFPDAISTAAWKINLTGEIVGRYQSADGTSHVFLLSGGKFTSIDFPDAFDTAPASIPFVGINAQGDIVSTYCDDLCTLFDGNVRGFLLSGGQFTPIDFPGAVTTVASGINYNSDIVGSYIDAPSGRGHGFLRSSEESH